MSESDASAARAATADWLRALTRTAGLAPSGSRTLAAIVDERAATDPRAPALIGEADALSYGELAALSRRCAGWALAQGLRAGDRVALMAANAPDVPAIWIGLGRLGIITALINTGLVGIGLRHSLAVAGAGHLIADAAFAERIGDSVSGPAGGLRVWIRGGSQPASFEAALAGCGPLTEGNHPAPVGRDPALLLFTSGTTGLSKAAFVSHYRIAMWSEWFAGLTAATPADRLYNCLPMYHSVGGVVAVGAMLAAGGAVIVRERFSARRFWPDVVGSRATIFQYIGELPRFLNAAPPQPLERAHRLRLACGNGLREGVWRTFAARFAIPRVIEFYAATEGSFSLFNLEGRPGSLGRVPGFLAHRSPVALVRFDPASEQPARGADGFCLRCAPDEPGEAIGRLGGDGLGTRFEGYTSVDDTEAKVLRDVFAAGDAWFRTGDLLRRDAQGFYVFVDRIGDTFRWRGENVATTEVADVVAAAPGVAAACVYGVAVPGAEGRAGMAALVAGAGFDPGTLHAHLAAELPAYARPLFLRLVADLDLTGTFRQQKAELRAQGYEAAAGSEVLMDGGLGYLPLDDELRRRLAAGTLRL